MTYFLIFWYFKNFASFEDIRRKYNSIVDLLTFTFNTKILSKIIILDYIKISSQTLSSNKMNEFFIINNLIIINLQ